MLFTESPGGSREQKGKGKSIPEPGARWHGSDDGVCACYRNEKGDYG